jgi:hypothetical protein
MDNPVLPMYQLSAVFCDFGAQDIHLTLEEFLRLKIHLAAFRGYPVIDAKRLYSLLLDWCTPAGVEVDNVR